MTRVPRIHNGEKMVFLANDTGNTGYIHAKEWNWTLTLHHIKKINSQWIKDLSDYKIPGRKHSGEASWLWSWYCFSWIQYQKHRQRKTKVDKWDDSKWKSFYTAKEIVNRVKKCLWEKIFVNHIFDKGLIFKIYSEFLQLNSKKPNNPIKKWANDLNRHFSREGK